ncbi:MAG: ATP-binding cassette domain-containing protein [Bacteroidia bacterium]|nr:ATP-binding cassette domain-containing protein [Bacteroidia bacterium]
MEELQHNNKRVVEMNGVKKSFNGNQVLKDINFTLDKGENLVVLGKSGTGKSVLIKCLVRLIEADEGEIITFEKNILQANRAELTELRGKIGFLFQGGALYDSMTVRENLEFPVRRKKKNSEKGDIDKLVEEVLDNVGLKDTIDKMPSELSGGQRKRVSLARTLIMKPELILYDEPTTGLDPVTSQEISELILEVQEKYGTAAIIITHDIKCAEITANRAMLIDDGTFIVEGTIEDLKRSPDPKVNLFFK